MTLIKASKPILLHNTPANKGASWNEFGYKKFSDSENTVRTNT